MVGKSSQHTHTHTCMWTNANRSRCTLAAMFRILMHPRGSLVLPPSSICETIQGPGEKECTGQVRSAFQRDRGGGGKNDSNQTKIPVTLMPETIAQYSTYYVDWQAYTCQARYTTLPNNAFIQLGENCIQVTKRTKKKRC